MSDTPGSSASSTSRRQASGARDDAARAWQAMSALVLNHDRKAAISAELGMSFGRSRVLRRLIAEPRTLKDLATALAADPPYVTLMVDKLEEEGYVERGPHPTDRRRKLVSLTPEGRGVAERAAEILASPPPGLVDLPRADLATLVEILERVDGPGPAGT